MMRLILATALALSLAACAGADRSFVGSPHGYAGQVDTLWADVDVFPTIMPEGNTQIVGRAGPDGMVDSISTYTDPMGRQMTGIAAQYAAKAMLCSVAPNAPECGGE